MCACVHIGGDGGQRRGWNTQPESVFVPIDLESLRARGVNVNASPPREFRVSIATQDSSSSGSSASSSSSCSKANDVLEGDAENGLQDQDTNAEGDAERGLCAAAAL